MRITIQFLFIFVLSSCYEPSDIRNELHGVWTYDPNFAVGDTISQYFEDDFEPNSRPKSGFEIRTDSGYYIHTYENLELINSSVRTALWVQEYEFITDSSGVIHFYDYDPEVKYDIHPRVYGSTEQFTITKKLGKSIIRISYENSYRYMLIIRIADGKMKLSDMGTTLEFARIGEL